MSLDELALLSNSSDMNCDLYILRISEGLSLPENGFGYDSSDWSHWIVHPIIIVYGMSACMR